KLKMSPTIQVNSKHIAWNRQGFFPLPEDSAESYERRICQLQDQELTVNECSARQIVKRYFDADPVWVPITYSNDGLHLWEAGCIWYNDNVEERPMIQLTSRFHRSSDYLLIYQKDEVLAHEYVHAIRAPLGSSQYEEIFSYLLSLDFAKGFLSHVMRALRVTL